MAFDTPILLLVFNRPESTRIVFEKIRLIQPRYLFIASDGPRVDNSDDFINVTTVREICTKIDWDCELKTLFRDDNLGCKNAVSSSITWFFENVDCGIVLEDDTVPSISFFYYCAEMLARYYDDETIGHIAGFSLLNEDEPTDYYFSRLVPIWGWASWKRAWNIYDIDMSRFDIKKDSIYKVFGKHAENVKKVFADHLRDNVDTWDTQWAFSCVENEFTTIVPFESMIQNIGFVSTATHTTSANNLIESIQANDLTFPIKHPQQGLKYNNYRFDEKYLDLLYSSQYSKRAKLKQFFSRIFAFR